YANTFKRYATYVRQYDPKNNWIYKVACGPNGEDYRWTEEVMRIAARHMNGLALHYYTVTHDWGHKGSATEFSQEEYYTTLRKAAHIGRIIDRHLEIMNRYDPNHRVDLIVDEWGTWHDVEPGTNPGYLYQQNTMRDAIVAGLTLNIFNKHADRIRMANIAQTINVLQAVALTDGPAMVLTPTYYVFKMYKDHQQNTLLGSYLTTPQVGTDSDQLPQLIESASVNAAGEICATITNTAADKPAEIKCQIADTAVAQITAEILTGAIDAYNSFEQTQAVKLESFTDFRRTEDGFVATLPACSVVKFNIQPRA
ncbi:MAG: alpha-N-arabinofuranosidase, partial [Clostridia bacterium]|nr:alpha-N-arabinofuranosidase [Clostridia bacterium]